MQWARQEYMAIYSTLQISARKAPPRQGVDNLLSTDMGERGPSKCPAVLTLLTRQGQAPRAKVRSLLWCLHQYLQLCLLPTHHGGWWVVVRALFWSWKLDPWAGCSLKARDYLCVPIRIAHQSPKQQSSHFRFWTGILTFCLIPSSRNMTLTHGIPEQLLRTRPLEASSASWFFVNFLNYLCFLWKLSVQFFLSDLWEGLCIFCSAQRGTTFLM